MTIRGKTGTFTRADATLILADLTEASRMVEERFEAGRLVGKRTIGWNIPERAAEFEAALAAMKAAAGYGGPAR